MSLKYREYEIRYNDPGVTVIRATSNSRVVQRNEFGSLEAGLNYILERLVTTESKDILDAINTMKYVKNDLREACNKLKTLAVAKKDPEPITLDKLKTKKPEALPIRRIIKK